MQDNGLLYICLLYIISPRLKLNFERDNLNFLKYVANFNRLSTSFNVYLTLVNSEK